MDLWWTKSETWFSLGCVIGGVVVSAGAVAEMGWANASFNCTGMWDIDGVLGKATAAIVADISKLVSSSNSNEYKLLQTFFHSNFIYLLQAVSSLITTISKGLIKVFICFQGLRISSIRQTPSFCHFAILQIFSCTSQLHIFVRKFSPKCL